MKIPHLLTVIGLLCTTLCFGQTTRLLNTNPKSAKQGEKLTVSISGHRTHFAQASQTVSFLSQGTNTIIYPYSFSAATNTLLETKYDIPSSAPTGLYDVVVYNEIDGFLSLDDHFLIQKVNVPKGKIVAITPNKSGLGTSLKVSISGDKTRFTQASATNIYLTKGSATPINAYGTSIINDDLLTTQFSIPSTASIGEYDVHVFMTGVDYYVKVDGFEVTDKPLPPTIVHVTPDSALAGKTTTVSIHARDAKFTTYPTADVTLIGSAGVLNPSRITIVNDTTVTFDLALSNNADTGLYDIRLEHDYYKSAIDVTDGLRIVKAVGFDQTSSHLLKIYPNPVQNNVQIQLPEEFSSGTVRLFDIAGQIILQQDLSTIGGSTASINLVSIPKGSYILRLHSGNKEYAAFITKN